MGAWDDEQSSFFPKNPVTDGERMAEYLKKQDQNSEDITDPDTENEGYQIPINLLILKML